MVLNITLKHSKLLINNLIYTITLPQKEIKKRKTKNGYELFCTLAP